MCLVVMSEADGTLRQENKVIAPLIKEQLL